MVAYYLLLGIPILLEVIVLFNSSNELNAVTEEKRIKSERRIILVFFFIFFLILACRHIEMGADIRNYRYFFFKIKDTKWSNLTEVETDYFYAILNKIVSTLGGDFQFFLAVVAFVSVLPFAIFYYKESENSLLTITIFINVSIFTMFFSGLRQTIAFAIGIIAFYYVKDKKLVKFLLWVFVAYMFHKSAFVLLALYPVYHINITKKSFKYIVPIVMVMFVLRRQVFTFLTGFLGEDFEDVNTKIQETGAYAIFILFILFTIYSFIGIKDENVDRTTIGLRNILVVATILQMFTSVHTLAMRMNYYFIPFIPVIISKITASGENEDDKNTVKTINTVLIIFFIAYFFYYAENGVDTLQLFPYKAFWE